MASKPASTRLRKPSGRKDRISPQEPTVVTDFFRDRETFHALQKKMFPKILAEKPGGERVRIWAAGATSGEAYSLAISLLEHLGDRAGGRRIQIFGTAADENTIEKARRGIFSAAELKGLSSTQLGRYFTSSNGSFQINQSIREMCLFARHDLTRDPPFLKLDLISCRDVLTDMKPRLQKRILSRFHWALNRSGILLLGTREALSASAGLFIPRDRKKRFLEKNSERHLLSYTRPASHEVSHQLMRALREEIVLEVRTALQNAIKSKRVVRKRFTGELMQAQEAANRTLARELHDVHSQELVGLAMEISSLKKDTKSEAEMTQRLSELAKKIGSIAKGLHQASRALHPTILEELGLGPALRQECDSFQKNSGIPTDFTEVKVPPNIAQPVVLCLYRVAQESLRNILKHASDSHRVRVFLAGRTNGIILEIEDAGDGFELTEALRKGGLGLISMQERIRLVNGKLTINSQPGKGTLVKAFVPVQSGAGA